MAGRGPSGDSRERLKILLVGHAFWPDEGSEPGLTWNWAWHLSKYHDTWAIAHPLHRAAAEVVIAGHSGRAPRVVWVDLPRKPEQGERGIRLHYFRWQRAALAQARRLHAAQEFDIVQHLSWGTVYAPPALWRLGAPFVWGPIGGGQVAPLRFGRYLGWRGTFEEAGRSLRRHLLPFLPPLRRAAANSTVILATNRETAEVVHRAGATRVELFLDNGVGPDQFVARQSLQDSFGSVVIEAMAAGLPVLALNHQGVGTLIPEHAAIKVPVTSPSATVQGLADGIRALAASPELGLRLSEAARSHAATESWSRRAVRMNALYRSCLSARAGRARLGARHGNPAELSESAA